MTVTKQSLASIVRQVLGVIATTFGILTQTVGALHIKDGWISGILTAMGPVILTVEHYVSDPSTGTPTTTTPTAPVTAALPPLPPA